jgi:hypothetical protein
LIRPPVAAEVLFFFKQGVHVAKYFRASKLLLNALCIKKSACPLIRSARAWFQVKGPAPLIIDMMVHKHGFPFGFHFRNTQ